MGDIEGSMKLTNGLAIDLTTNTCMLILVVMTRLKILMKMKLVELN